MAPDLLSLHCTEAFTEKNPLESFGMCTNFPSVPGTGSHHFHHFLSGRSMWRDHVGKSLPAQCAHTDVYPAAVSVYTALFHSEAKTECGYLPLSPQLFCSNCSCQIQWLLSPLSIELFQSCLVFQKISLMSLFMSQTIQGAGRRTCLWKNLKEKVRWQLKSHSWWITQILQRSRKY